LRGTMRVPRRDQQHARTIENRGERVGVPIRPATDW
jgi:hypothetical protein